jgi:hypothetical protein
MVVATAVKPAGGFVLPADITRWSDLITSTANTKGLDPLPLAGTTNVYFNMLLLTSEGRVIADRALLLSLKELTHFYSYCQHVHIFRTGGKLDAYDFFYDEVRASLENNPWVGKPWFNENMLRWAELLPRPSETQPGLIAYFQNAEKRARNIRTPIKPGRFLTKFFSDVLTETQIHELALDWSNEYDLSKAKITQDADEIEDIYVNGPSSCMAGRYSSPHPSRVYAGPDLGVAYLGKTDDPSARAVVWPERKIYATPYGDTSRLRAALEEMGYTRGSFSGARLQRIEYYDKLVMPYLDIADSADDMGDYIVIGRGGELETSNTNGLSTQEPQYNCDDCNASMDEDERNYISSCDRDVCDHCYGNNYFYCEGYHESYKDEERAELSDESDSRGSFSKDFVESSDDWFYCDQSEVWHHVDDTPQIDTYEGDSIALSYAGKNGFFCEHVGKWTLEINFQVKLTNGNSIHMGTFENEASFNKWLLDRGLIVGDPEQIDPNQLPLPLHEAA